MEYLLEIILAVFSGLMSSIGVLVLFNFRGLNTLVERMSDSINNLNKEIATLINNQDWHYREINDNKERIISLEKKENSNGKERTRN